MTHQQFKERLEEIQERLFWYGHQTHKASLDPRNSKGLRALEDEAYSKATQSLITLFEDYTKAIVGEEESEFDAGAIIVYDKYMNPKEVFSPHKTCNQLRQTINQTSKTILRGQDNG